ncbi:MAG: hypothetical protein ACI9E1_001103, partial [Cryomorphaceae bacterium]
MKLPMLSKKFSLFIILATAAVVPSVAQVYPNGTGSNSCYNSGHTYDCPECEEYCTVIKLPTGSFVHNGLLDYHSWANDFRLPGSPSGCKPCGGNTGISADLHTVQVQRYLHSRFGNGVKSFGRASALAGYDVSLSWPENWLEGIMTFHEEDSINYGAQMNWQSDRMTWAPIGAADAAFGLSLFDSTGNPITTYASRELAHTGVYLKADGSSIHFEMIRKSNRVYGRPVAFADRNGNITSVEYIDAQPAFGNDVSIVSEYFRRTKITDPYGRELNFEYALEGSSYLISKITHPDGQFTTYSYKSLSFYGKVIDQVNHPDGTISTNNWNRNKPTGFWELEMFEATADAGKRRKTVFISTNKAPDENGVVISTAGGLTRMIRNGVGEMVYGNRTSSSGERFVFGGGNKAYSINILNNTKGLGGFKEITDGATLQTTFFTADLNTLAQANRMNRTNSNEWRESETTDAFGRQKLIPTRNPVSKSPTLVAASDGTNSTTVYN